MHSYIKTAQTNDRNPDLKTVLVHTNRKIGKKTLPCGFLGGNKQSFMDRPNKTISSMKRLLKQLTSQNKRRIDLNINYKKEEIVIKYKTVST